MKLKDQTIIVTGGSGDIGKFVATTLLKDCKKIIVIDVNAISFDTLKEKGISCYKCDLTNYDAVVMTVNKIFEDFPESSILINCAGKIYNAPLINLLSREDKKHNPKDWDEIIKINLSAVFYVTSCFLLLLLFQPHIFYSIWS